MSLVGPRPERPFFVERFKEEIPRYMIKHQVRPGLTGWAQVNGYRLSLIHIWQGHKGAEGICRGNP